MNIGECLFVVFVAGLLCNHFRVRDKSIQYCGRQHFDNNEEYLFNQSCTYLGKLGRYLSCNSIHSDDDFTLVPIVNASTEYMSDTHPVTIRSHASARLVQMQDFQAAAVVYLLKGRTSCSLSPRMHKTSFNPLRVLLARYDRYTLFM